MFASEESESTAESVESRVRLRQPPKESLCVRHCPQTTRTTKREIVSIRQHVGHWKKGLQKEAGRTEAPKKDM